MNNTEREDLAYRRDRVLRWIETQGIAICTDGDATDKLKELLLIVEPVFGDMMKESGLVAIFAYHMDQQPEEFRERNAMAWRDVTTDGKGTLYAIGVSVEALEYGVDWSVLSFLHELCHVLLPDVKPHGHTFHEILDYLVGKYNFVTDSDIENDYYGLEA